MILYVFTRMALLRRHPAVGITNIACSVGQKLAWTEFLMGIRIIPKLTNGFARNAIKSISLADLARSWVTWCSIRVELYGGQRYGRNELAENPRTAPAPMGHCRGAECYYTRPRACY